MCTSYADYWRCGHVRRHRLVPCRRDYDHFLDRERGRTYAADCAACWWDGRGGAPAPAEPDPSSSSYYYVRRLYHRRDRWYS